MDGVDLGNWVKLALNSDRSQTVKLTGVGFTQSCSRAFRKSDILGLACLADLIQSWDGLLERGVCLGSASLIKDMGA